MRIFKSERKVQNHGTSLAITLPAMFTKIHDIVKGYKMKVYYTTDGILIATKQEDPKIICDSLENLIENFMSDSDVEE